MLSTELAARGLSITGEHGLKAVWDSQPRDFDADRLFQLLLQKGSVLYYLLNLEGFDLSKGGLLDDRCCLSTSALADRVTDIARGHGHSVVNEVHLFKALLALCPHGFSGRFASLREQYQHRHPEGSVRWSNLLRIAEESGDAERARRVREVISETPLSRARIIELLDAYLSAEHFPFGSAEWQKYLASKRDDQPSAVNDHSLVGFSAHRLRDEVLRDPSAAVGPGIESRDYVRE